MRFGFCVGSSASSCVSTSSNSPLNSCAKDSAGTGCGGSDTPAMVGVRYSDSTSSRSCSTTSQPPERAVMVVATQSTRICLALAAVEAVAVVASRTTSARIAMV